MGKKNRARGSGGALRLYMDVLGLEDLHYGLWDGEPLTYEGLKSAQARYTSHLIELLGPDGGSLLDCGCGTGATALKLRAHGFEVEGLTPDPYQRQTFVSRTGLTCHQARFQDFHTGRRHGTLLMSESCGYIPLDRLFKSVLRVVAQGGTWLVADYFTLYKDGTRLTKSGHLQSLFLERAREAGLVLEYEEDITERVTPTLDIARIALDDKALPAARMLGEWLSDRYPVLYPPLFKTAKFLLRKPIAKIDDQRILIDSKAFSEAKRYMIYKFRIPWSGSAATPGS